MIDVEWQENDDVQYLLADVLGGLHRADRRNRHRQVADHDSATVDGWNVIITVGVDGKIDVDPWYADAFSEDEEYTLPDWLIPDNLSANVPITDPLTSENREAIGFAIGMAVGEALIEWSAEAVGDWWDSLPPGSHNLILQGIVLALT